MTPEQFVEEVEKKNPESYGLCSPPIKAQDGLDVLIEHFLGEDWYVALSMNQEQTNTEAIHAILNRNRKKTPFLERLKSWFRKPENPDRYVRSFKDNEAKKFLDRSLR